jgi:hypothetical protein
MSEIDVNKIREWLKEGLHKIIFTKVDGEKREIIGTLSPKYLPAIEPLVEGEVRKTRPPAPGVISVYLPEEMGWRSFKIENLIGIIPMFTPTPPTKD